MSESELCQQLKQCDTIYLKKNGITHSFNITQLFLEKTIQQSKYNPILTWNSDYVLYYSQSKDCIYDGRRNYYVLNGNQLIPYIPSEEE